MTIPAVHCQKFCFTHFIRLQEVYFQLKIAAKLEKFGAQMGCLTNKEQVVTEDGVGDRDASASNTG